MNRCSKCNNELIAGTRFCNICGTPVPGASATPAAPAAPIALKRMIQPEIRRVRPPHVGQTATGSLVPGAAPVEHGTPDKSVESAGSDAPEKQEAQKQSAPRLANPPVFPKTTIEFSSIKVGQGDEKQKSAPPSDTSATADRANEVEEIPTAQLPDLPVVTPVKAPVVESPAQGKAIPSVTASESDKTVPLLPTQEKTGPLPPAPDKTMPLPPPNGGTNRAPGIIRPIVSSASLRQNTPIQPGHTPPNPISPLPAVPNTPPLSVEKPRQTDNARFPRPSDTPAPGSPSQPQDTSR